MAEVVGIIDGVQTHVWSVRQCGGEHRGQEASQPYPPVPTACLASLHPLSVLFLSFPTKYQLSFFYIYTFNELCCIHYPLLCRPRASLTRIHLRAGRLRQVLDLSSRASSVSPTVHLSPVHLSPQQYEAVKYAADERGC